MGGPNSAAPPIKAAGDAAAAVALRFEPPCARRLDALYHRSHIIP
jgi:hypothetical protein